MPRWLIGSLAVIYLAGTFGFGLTRYVADYTPTASDAVAYGAQWPAHMLHALRVI